MIWDFADSRFSNVNIFGLILLVAVSGTAALTDIILLRFLVYLSRFRRALAPRIDRWIQDGVLQLQRRAFEAQRQGHWINIDGENPVTRTKELLDELPMETAFPAFTSSTDVGSAPSTRKGDDLPPKEPFTLVQRETSSTFRTLR